MPVLEVTRMWSRSGVKNETSDGKKFTLSVSEGYQVTTTPDTLGAEILSHPDIPKAGQIIVGTTVMVRSVVPDKISPIFWIVDVQASGDTGESSDNPLLQKAIIRRRALMSEEPVDQDYFGKPIATVCGEPINGVTKKIFDMQYTITKNYLLVVDELVTQYLDAVNSDVWFGYAPGRAKLVGYSAEEIEYQTQFGKSFYQRVTWDVIVRTPYNITPNLSWAARTLHQGFYEYPTPQATKPSIAFDGNGNDVTQPVLLKLDGSREGNPDNAVWLYWQLYNTLPYNSLIGALE
jgi:hypothetical protein